MDPNLVFVDYDPLDDVSMYDNATLMEDCSKTPITTKPPQEVVFRPKIEKAPLKCDSIPYKRPFVECGW